MKAWNRILSVIVVLTLAVNAEECPEEFTQHGDFCYRFFGNNKGWHEAEAHCNEFTASDGTVGHLVSIHSDEENEFVRVLINLGVGWTPADRGIHVNIGLIKPEGGITRNGKTPRGDFEWTDSTPYDYGNWVEGEPNGGIIEHCVIMVEFGVWDDTGCGSRSYICKIPLPSTRYSTDTTFWTSYAGSLYRFYCDHSTWDQAQTTCDSESAHLVIINDSDENDFVSTLTASSLKKAGPPTWIGLREKTPVSFKWSDGSDYVGDYNKLCCVHTNDGKKRGVWNNGDCFNKLAFVCERNE